MMEQITGRRQSAVSRTCRTAWVLLSLSAWTPSPIYSQTVQGQLIDAATGNPIEGALAVLVEEGGPEVDGTITNHTGRFRLRARGSGRYVVRVERIGYETVSSSVVELANSQIFGIRMETGQRPVELAEVRVEGSRQCQIRPSEGLRLAQLWEEARKALRVQDWTIRQGLYEYLVSNYTRRIDPGTDVVVSEDRETGRRIARIPIRSRTVEDLVGNGFIRDMRDGSYEYNGPDASVLLSDLFLDTHCFRLREGRDRPNLIGLSFEPVEATENPGIQGTLWLDAASAELQFLEFGYTWSPFPEAEGVARGRIEFEGLPNGAWIVRRWWIRMPTVSAYREPLDPGATRFKVTTITEAGGEVRQVFSLDEPIVEETQRGRITGQVWDSIRGEPLDSASVYLSGTSHMTRSDSGGHFQLQEIPPGLFRVAFSHPRLDSLGVFPPAKEVESRPGEEVEVSLGLPSMETILAASCERPESISGAHAVVGKVTVAGTEDPVPGASVSARWQASRVTGAAHQKAVRVFSDTEGFFVLCGVPANDPDLEVVASFLDHESELRSPRPRPGSFAVLNLQLHLPMNLVSSSDPATRRSDPSVRQGIRGTVLDGPTGDPIQNVEVILRSAPDGLPITAVTDGSGFFQVETEEPGRHMLTATALGYEEAATDSLLIPEGQSVLVRVEMVPAPLGLEPVVVVAESRPYHLEVQGFYQRADQGFGHFIHPEELEARHPTDVTDLLRGVPGLRLAEASEFGTRVLVARPGLAIREGAPEMRSFCEPRLYVDGVQVSQPTPRNEEGHLGVYPDQVVQVQDIAAVEVHLRGSSIPLIYGGSQEGCGAILIWTKRE